MFWRKKKEEPGSVAEARLIAKSIVDQGFVKPAVLRRVSWYRVNTNVYKQTWQNVHFRAHWWSTNGLILTMVRTSNGWRLDGQVHHIVHHADTGVDIYNAVRLPNGSYKISKQGGTRT